LHDYAACLALELALLAHAERCRGARLDSLYWGGGTPTLLPPAAFTEIVAAIRANFEVAPTAEHTVEVAPGTLTPATLDALRHAGVNRLSFGVQSFHDEELRAVGRLHRRATIADDLARARAAGISNLSLDLIAGLPHQTPATWRDSVEGAIASGVQHLSIYMLEVDEDSRLGNELLAGGVRYHAHSVPDEDQVADAYEWAVATLAAAGFEQYEISNFARPGFASFHNEGYWLRRPYLGAGLDAHSFFASRRWANPDALDPYLTPLRAGVLPRSTPAAVSPQAATEEHYFLGLRRNQGVIADPADRRIAPLVADGLLAWNGPRIALTPRGRLLSNRVFTEFLAPAGVPCAPAPCEAP